jgi:hypothetical protein
MQQTLSEHLTFFAFVRLVMMRRLVVPLQSQAWAVLPSQQHQLLADYFELGG